MQLGDALEAEPPEALPSPLEPEPIALAILWEDADLLVLDKPAGLVVHPAPGHASGTLVNALLHHCADLAGVGGVLRPGIVHRLDRGTSGVLVVAKNDFAHRALAEQFRDHSIERIYHALVRGVPAQEAGRVDRPIGRHPRERKRMSVHAHGGARGAHGVARAGALPAPASAPGSRCGPRPDGRTRSACTSPRWGCRSRAIRSTAVGARAPPDPGRPALHAAVLGFQHPRSGERLRFEAPLPADLAESAGRAGAPRGGAVNALRHALLDAVGVEHGFGVRGLAPPPGLRRPQQVHGARVAQAAGLPGRGGACRRTRWCRRSRASRWAS